MATDDQSTQNDTEKSPFGRLTPSACAGPAAESNSMLEPLPKTDATELTFAWTDDAGSHTAARTFTDAPDEKPWKIPTGKNVRTKWVEMKPRYARK